MVKSRRYGSFEVLAPSLALDYSDGPTVDASQAAFEMAGIGPEDVDVAQLQDTESGAEVMHMAENGFCEHGEQEQMLANGETEITGRLPVNTDGGCLANGEPVGASGLNKYTRTCFNPERPVSARFKCPQGCIHPCLWSARHIRRDDTIYLS